MKKLAIKYIVTYIVMLIILFGVFCLDALNKDGYKAYMEVTINE